MASVAGQGNLVRKRRGDGEVSMSLYVFGWQDETAILMYYALR